VNFKVDENLPAEAAGILRGSGFGADTVGDEISLVHLTTRLPA